MLRCRYARREMRRPFLFWGFKSSQEILENRLGALERSVMDVVWERGDISVREACARSVPTSPTPP